MAPMVVVVVGSEGCCCGHLDTLHSEYYIQILMGLYWVRLFAHWDLTSGGGGGVGAQ